MESEGLSMAKAIEVLSGAPPKPFLVNEVFVSNRRLAKITTREDWLNQLKNRHPTWQGVKANDEFLS